MTENDYLLAWALYAIAALGCLLVWCRMTGWMWRWLREPLQLLMAVLFLSPTIVDPAKDKFAPTIAIIAMDLLLKVGSNAWRAVADLVSYLIIGGVLYLLFVALRWLVQNWQKKRRNFASTPEPTQRELMEQSDADDGITFIDSNGDRRLRIQPRV